MQLMNFLLVEDNEAHAAIVLQTVEQHRIANGIVRVRDGEEALRYLRNEPPFETAPRPDVIFLDLGLPQVSGLEVLRAVRTDPKLAQLPVVVMSASDDDSDRARAYEYRANSYVTKPVNLAAFQQMVLDLSLYWGVWNRPVSTGDVHPRERMPLPRS